jgi:hypothetical protein
MTSWFVTVLTIAAMIASPGKVISSQWNFALYENVQQGYVSIFPEKKYGHVS